MPDIDYGHTDYGRTERPGGLALTARGVALCRFSPQDRLADIGCGDGATIRYLAKTHGLSITGVDLDPALSAEERGFRVLHADAARLPFDDAALDGLIFECSLSKMEPPDAVLCECARVLKPGGRLMVSDLYARGEAAVLCGPLGRIERRETIVGRAGVCGFSLAHFEDCSDALAQLWANLIMESGAAPLRESFGTDADGLKRIRCGYFLAVFRKGGDHISRVDRWTGVLMDRDGPVSVEALREWQLERISETMVRAAAGGFYRRAGFPPDGVKDFCAFARLPFTTAADLSRCGQDFLLVSPDRVKRIVSQVSSGTTGPGKRVFFTEQDVLRTEEFFTRALSDYVCAGQRAMVFLSGNAADGIGDLLRRAFHRLGVDALIHGVVTDFEAAAARARGIDFFIGLPSQMLRLCRTAPRLSPRGVLLSADYIPESVLHALRTGWNCKVIRHFGMTETCFGCATDCAAGGGQHIRHGDFYLEIVSPEDGTPVPDGGRGEIVLTTLRSEAFPLLRYRTGDLGSLETGECACGGTLPRLGRVLGRIEALKHPLNIHALDELIYSFDGVLDYEACFDGTQLTLTVDGGGVDPHAVEAAFGVPLRLRYAPVPPIPGSGKRRLLTAAE